MQIFSVFNPVRTSSFVSAISVTPEMVVVCFATTRSSHPQRRGLLVVVPYSCPCFCKCSPFWSVSSVGSGPSPTLVVYALRMPIVLLMCCGGMPDPIDAPPELTWLLVV